MPVLFKPVTLVSLTVESRGRKRGGKGARVEDGRAAPGKYRPYGSMVVRTIVRQDLAFLASCRPRTLDLLDCGQCPRWGRSCPEPEGRVSRPWDRAAPDRSDRSDRSGALSLPSLFGVGPWAFTSLSLPTLDKGPPGLILGLDGRPRLSERGALPPPESTDGGTCRRLRHPSACRW